MAKVAVLYICTGDYIRFWEGFYSSMKEKFLTGSEVHYFVFTDAPKLPAGEEDDKVHRRYQENLGWPGNTLYRFRMFLGIEDQLRDFDYIFFFNANYLCLVPISEEEFLPARDQLLVTLHPGYYRSPSRGMPYERNPASTAYISFYSLRSRHYFCGGLNGGGRERYLKLIRDIDARIRKDDDNGIVALWHDESHLNRYMLGQRNYKILSPSYAFPEERLGKLNFEPKLLLIDKHKIMDLKGRDPARKGQRTLGTIGKKIVRRLGGLKNRLIK